MELRYLLFAIGFFLALQTASTKAEGKLSYGDQCSVQSAILQVFTQTELSDDKKCNGDQGLICTGTCTCPPTRVWHRGPFWGIFGGSGCIVGANGPCTKNDRCVDNAICGDNIPLCFCNEGYHAHELQCISSSGHSFSGSATVRVSWPTVVMLICMVVRVFSS